MKKVRVIVRLKNGVLDPQGKTVEHALHTLGFEEANNVRIGKIIEFDLENNATHDNAADRIKAMCDKLLANPVIEDYEILGA